MYEPMKAPCKFGLAPHVGESICVYCGKWLGDE